MPSGSPSHPRGRLILYAPIIAATTEGEIVLTRLADRGTWELARQNGAIACFVKRHMEYEALDRAIQNGVALMGLLPKEDRYRSL
jgi:hypothetical protein